jgi:Undecaprenyl-phosphate glucose phosphotransferase
VGGDLDRPSGPSFSAPIVAGLIVCIDIVTIVAAGMASWVVALAWKDAGAAGRCFYASLAIATLAIAIASYSRLYEFEVVSRPRDHLTRLSLALVKAFVFFLFLGFSFQHVDTAFSRVWVYVFFVVSQLAFLAERYAVSRLIYGIADRGSMARNVAIVGAGEQAVALVHLLVERNAPWVHVLGFFDDRHQRYGKTIEGLPVLGGIADLVAFSRDTRVDDVFVALPWMAEMRLFDIFDTLRVVPANLHLAPEIVGSRFQNASFVPYFGITVLKVAEKPIEGWNYVAKWVEDKIVAIGLLVVLSPILLAAALAIRLDSPGPIFFRQKRLGFNNNLIEVLKFRTMRHDETDENADRQVTRTDPRVTRVGRLLRRTSIDELPQLINVLKGEMSVVGPRPHALGTKAGGRLFQDVVEAYAHRHKIKPGITGWAQVNGWRGETDTEEKLKKRVECDLYYIENWSLVFDLLILLRTVGVVLSSKEAY